MKCPHCTQDIEQIYLDQWQGKSSFEMREFPIMIQVIKYQKVKGGDPKEIRTNIPKKELRVLQELIIKDTTTREMARAYCLKQEILQTDKGKRLFENGLFMWDNFFSWRKMHNKFTLMLNVLEKQNHIKYAGGKIFLLGF